MYTFFRACKAAAFAVGFMFSGLHSAPASAQAFYNGYLSNLQYGLTDLNPNDGVAPSIIFEVDGQTVHTSGGLEGRTDDYGTQTTALGQQIQQAELSRFNYFRAASFFSGLNTLVISTSGAAEGVSNGGDIDSGGYLNASSGARSDWVIGYELSAGAQVTFKMDYWLTAITANDPNTSRAVMTAEIGSGNGPQSDSANAYVDSFSSGSGSGETVGTFEAVVGNTSLVARRGELYLSIVGSANEAVMAAAVPEPETYALLLVGLVLTGAAVKRRNAKQV